MRNYREKTVRNRSKNMRTLTIREIKMAVCAHETLAPTGPSEQHLAGGIWQTKLTCPACGAWYIRETPDAIRPAPADQAGVRAGVMSGSRRVVAHRFAPDGGRWPGPTVESTDGGRRDAGIALGLRDAGRP